MNAGSNRSQKLKILQVLRAPVGGLFRHVCDLTKGLSDLGHEVGLVCDSSPVGEFWDSRLCDIESHCALGITKLPIGRLLSPTDFISLAKLTRLACKFDIDILHGHGAKGGAYARLCGRFARFLHKSKKPVTIYTPHGGSLHYQKGTFNGLLYHTLERILFPIGDRLLFESTYSRTRYGALINPKADAYPVIHNGLHEAEFDPVSIDKDATSLVYAGELRTLKGIGVLLEAMALLPESVTLTLAGSGPDEDTFRKQVHALGLESRVRFLGPQNVRESLSHGRIAILPSSAESMPYIILESLAMRHPIIATRVGGIPEIFGPDESHLIAPNNPDELAHAISIGLHDLPMLQEKTDLLSLDIRKNFTLDNMVNRIINEYHQALNRAYCSES
jgi:glycosyltransferase involved in cell wall biosynthesis